MSTPAETDPRPAEVGSGGVHPAELGDGYSRYVLAVLVVVYVLNFLDRNIITILAEDIKADLGMSDSQIGFLYGTAFAVFYAVFGIPLGRLADVWNRRSLISVGLAFWSLMTAVSGLARSFSQLAGARIGPWTMAMASGPIASITFCRRAWNSSGGKSVVNRDPPSWAKSAA